VLVLRYYEDRQDTEIAGLLGRAPGTVRGYASRALTALRAPQIQPLNHIRASQEVYGRVWPTSTGYR
jgi:hypothetical protein